MQVAVRAAFDEELVQMLRAGQLDLVVAELPAPASDLSMRALTRDELAVARRRGHPLLSRGTLQLADLTEQRWVLQRGGSRAARRITALFVAQGLTPPTASVDVLFSAGIWNTLLFAVTAVGVQMLIGLALAVLISDLARGKAVYRTIFLLPIVVPGIVIGAIWKLMYNYDFGIINQVVGHLGLAPQDWLGNPSLALLSVIVVDIWHWTPFCFLLILAGVESLPQDIYEAARVDGATGWQRFRRITLPLLMLTLVVTFVFRTILAFKVFDEVFLLTGGGPGTATEVISFTIYRRFFTEDRVGHGSAMSLVTFVALALVITVAVRATRRRGGAP